MADELLKRSEVAAIFKVKLGAVYTWEKAGLIKPAEHVNGRPRYKMEDVKNLSAKKSLNHAE